MKKPELLTSLNIIGGGIIVILALAPIGHAYFQYETARMCKAAIARSEYLSTEILKELTYRNPTILTGVRMLNKLFGGDTSIEETVRSIIVEMSREETEKMNPMECYAAYAYSVAFENKLVAELSDEIEDKIKKQIGL